MDEEQHQCIICSKMFNCDVDDPVCNECFYKYEPSDYLDEDEDEGVNFK